MNAMVSLFHRRGGLAQLIPGLCAVLIIAACAMFLRGIPGLSTLSPLIIAVSIGILLGHILHLPTTYQPGVAFAGRRLLRFAIILLGFQLSASQIAAIGVEGIATVVIVVAATFIAVSWLGKILRVDATLTSLIAAGTSICGASAVAAMSTVNGAHEEDVTYSIAVVTAFGTALMFLLPIAGHSLGLDGCEFGVWAGASVHEVAQVTGTAFQFSNIAGETGVIIKLTRVVMLAPLVMIFAWWLRRRNSPEALEGASPGFPFFVVGFILAAILNSIFPLTSDIRAGLMNVTSFMMSMALAALGLNVRIQKLKAKGVRPLALGALSTMLIVGLSLGLIMAEAMYAH
jgi:uncharacterized integral membrane protein (TIGR00698 family)